MLMELFFLEAEQLKHNIQMTLAVKKKKKLKTADLLTEVGPLDKLQLIKQLEAVSSIILM